MTTGFNADKAKEVLGSFSAQAEEMMKEDSKLEEILKGTEERLKDIPKVGESLSRLPLMLSLIRSYIAKEYTNVSPKVVVSMVSALIYLLKGRDLIPDKTPLIGYADDIAVTGLALKLVEKELDDYAAWRQQRTNPEQ